MIDVASAQPPLPPPASPDAVVFGKTIPSGDLVHGGVAIVTKVRCSLFVLVDCEEVNV